MTCHFLSNISRSHVIVAQLSRSIYRHKLILQNYILILLLHATNVETVHYSMTRHFLSNISRLFARVVQL